MRPARNCVLAAAVLVCVACNEEKRSLQAGAAAAAAVQVTPQVELQPGVPLPPPDIKNPFEKNQWAIAQGKRLFSNFNCAGCHSSGGGGAIGPPLIDDAWIYGAKPANIFDTIVQGRPNGMPSFGAKIPEYQIWQLVAYVQSMALDQPGTTKK
jgi:cytochrome c oxidase cbb3-type subunit 3